MANVFFQATKDALDNITAAFDFVHPLRASMCIHILLMESPSSSYV